MPEETVKDYLHRIRIDTGESEGSLQSVIGVLKDLRTLLADLVQSNRALVGVFESIATQTNKIRVATESSARAIRGELRAKQINKEITDQVIESIRKATGVEDVFAEALKKATAVQGSQSSAMARGAADTDRYAKSVRDARDAVLSYEMAARQSPVFAPGYTPGGGSIATLPGAQTLGMESMRKAASFASLESAQKYWGQYGYFADIMTAPTAGLIDESIYPTRDRILRSKAVATYSPRAQDSLTRSLIGFEMGAGAAQTPPIIDRSGLDFGLTQRRSALITPTARQSARTRTLFEDIAMSAGISGASFPMGGATGFRDIANMKVIPDLLEAMTDKAEKAGKAFGTTMRKGVDNLKEGIVGLGNSFEDIIKSWTRHIDWFVQGSLIYLGLQSIIKLVQASIEGLTEATNTYLDTQARLGYTMGETSSSAAQRLSSFSKDVQPYGVTPAEAGVALQETARITKDTSDQQAIMIASAKLAAIAQIEQADAVEALVGITRQANLEFSESERILDTLATLYRVGSDDLNEYVTAIERSAALAPAMGLTFSELAALVATVTEVTARSGPQLSAFMSQMQRTPTSPSGRSRLSYAGIDSSGKSTIEILKEAAALWPSLSESQRQFVASGFGGAKYSSEVRSLIENFSRFTEIQAEINNNFGESEKLLIELSESGELGAKRVQAAWKLAALEIADVLDLTERQARRVEKRERRAQRTASIFSVATQRPGETIRQLGETEGALHPAMLPSIMFSFMWGGIKDLADKMLGIERPGPIEADIQRGADAAVSGVPKDIQVLNLLKYGDDISRDQAEKLQELVNQYDNFFVEQGFATDVQRRQLLVLEGSKRSLETISGSNEAISLATDELLSNQKRMEGAWGLPGPAMVPIDSVFKQTSGLEISQSVPNLPMIEKGFGSSSILKKPGEQQQAIASGGPMVVQNTIQIDGQQVSDVSEVHQGEKFEKNMASGGDFSSNYAPGLGGVFP